MTGVSFYALQRISYSAEGTFGALIDPAGNHLCFTAELPWCDNEPEKSCIPTGIYDVRAYTSLAHPNVWELLNVPGRAGILIHNGNIPEVDSLGCIIVGMKLGFLETRQAVLQSDIALDMLRKELPNSLILSIIEPISSST